MFTFVARGRSCITKGCDVKAKDKILHLCEHPPLSCNKVKKCTKKLFFFKCVCNKIRSYEKGNIFVGLFTWVYIVHFDHFSAASLTKLLYKMGDYFLD